jgi:hypothetical protein
MKLKTLIYYRKIKYGMGSNEGKPRFPLRPLPFSFSIRGGIKREP